MLGCVPVVIAGRATAPIFEPLLHPKKLVGRSNGVLILYGGVAMPRLRRQTARLLQVVLLHLTRPHLPSLHGLHQQKRPAGPRQMARLLRVVLRHLMKPHLHGLRGLHQQKPPMGLIQPPLGPHHLDHAGHHLRVLQLQALA